MVNVLAIAIMSRLQRLVIVFGEEEDKEALLAELGQNLELTDCL